MHFISSLSFSVIWLELFLLLKCVYHISYPLFVIQVGGRIVKSVCGFYFLNWCIKWYVYKRRVGYDVSKRLFHHPTFHEVLRY